MGYDNSDEGLALVRRLSEVTSRCESKNPTRARAWLVRIGALLLLIGAYSSWHAHTVYLMLLSLGETLIGLVMFALPLTQMWADPIKFYGISRNSRKSFFQRKGDDLLVGIISGVVGAAIGALLGVAGTLFVQAHTSSNATGSTAQSTPEASAKSPGSQ